MQTCKQLLSKTTFNSSLKFLKAENLLFAYKARCMPLCGGLFPITISHMYRIRSSEERVWSCLAVGGIIIRPRTHQWRAIDLTWIRSILDISSHKQPHGTGFMEYTVMLILILRLMKVLLDEERLLLLLTLHLHASFLMFLSETAKTGLEDL